MLTGKIVTVYNHNKEPEQRLIGDICKILEKEYYEFENITTGEKGIADKIQYDKLFSPIVSDKEIKPTSYKGKYLSPKQIFSDNFKKSKNLKNYKLRIKEKWEK